MTLQTPQRINNTKYLFLSKSQHGYANTRELECDTDKPTNGFMGKMQIGFSNTGDSVLILRSESYHGLSIGERVTSSRFEYHIDSDTFTDYLGYDELTKRQKAIYRETLLHIARHYAELYPEDRQTEATQERVRVLKGETTFLKGIVTYGYRQPRKGEGYLIEVDNFQRYMVQIATHDHSPRMAQRYIVMPVYTDEEKELIGLQI